MSEKPESARAYSDVVPSFIAIGTVDDVFAGTNTYHVRVANSVVECVALSHFSKQPGWNLHEIGYYTVGDQVLVTIFSAIATGYIIGAAPSPASLPQLDNPPTFTGRAWLNDTENTLVHTAARKLLGEGVKHYGSGRPRDMFPGVDNGFMNDLGVGIGITKLEAFLQASDACSVQAFAEEALLRITGLSLESQSGVRESREWIGSGRGVLYDLLSFNYGRSLGAASGQPTDALEEDAAGGVIKKGADKERVKPVGGYDQSMIPDFMRIGTGSAFAEITAAPPEDTTGISRLSERSVIPRQTSLVGRMASGALIFRSAQSVSIEKYGLCPAPKLVTPTREETDRDSEKLDPYEFAGEEGVGYAAAMLDYQAYLVNWVMAGAAAGAHMYVKSEAGEASLTYKAGGSSRIRSDGFLPPPPFTEYTPDPDGPAFRYFQNRAGIYIMRDGSILLEDGYGSQQLFSRGNIYQSCAGDVFRIAGRNAVDMAGHDVILKGGGSVDVTSSSKDIRLKAERNMHMLSGNSGAGSTLIENRAETAKMAFDGAVGEDVTAGGIVIKAKDSGVAIRGKRVGIQSENSLVLYTDGTLSCKAAAISRTVSQTIVDRFDTDLSGSTDRYNLYSAQGVFFNSSSFFYTKARAVFLGGANGQVYVNGSLTAEKTVIAAGNVLVGKQLQVKGAVVSEGANIASAHLNRNGGPTGKLEEFPEVDLRESDWRPQYEASIELTESTTSRAEQTLKGADYQLTQGDSSLVGDSLWDAIAFTCRNPAQYLTDTLFMYEFRWQQMYRAQGDGHAWNEPDVEGVPGGEVTQPFPGKAAWERSGSFVQVNGKLWDTETGRPTAGDVTPGKDGAPMWPGEKPEGASIKETSLKDGFLVSVPVK